MLLGGEFLFVKVPSQKPSPKGAKLYRKESVEKVVAWGGVGGVFCAYPTCSSICSPLDVVKTVAEKSLVISVKPPLNGHPL